MTFTDVCNAATDYGLAMRLDTSREGWLTDDSPTSMAYTRFTDCLRALLDQKEER